MTRRRYVFSGLRSAELHSVVPSCRQAGTADCKSALRPTARRTLITYRRCRPSGSGKPPVKTPHRVLDHLSATATAPVGKMNVSDLRQSRRLEVVNGSKPYSDAGIGRTPRRGHPFCAMQCFLSPHPSPLPWGEGEPFSPRRTSQTRRLSTARCSLFPLPEGEGQGEGKRRGLPFPELSNWASPPAEPEVSLNDYAFQTPAAKPCYPSKTG